MSKIVGIYKITSPSGKVYIGQSWNIKHRWYTYKGSSCKLQPKLHSSFIKYGARNHTYEIIHELPKDVAQRVLDAYEILYIDQYKICGVHLLNLMSGGFGGQHSNETKLKIGTKSKGHPPNKTSFKKGQVLERTTEWIQKISEANKGRKCPEDVKKRLSELNKGAKNPKYGKPVSEETKKKIRDAQIGKKRPPEIGIKLSKLLKGRISNRKGAVLSEETKRKISESKKKANQDKRLAKMKNNEGNSNI